MSRLESAKQRGENEIEFSRIVAFSDGVFAIAITLLVLQFDVPEGVSNGHLWPVLWDQRHDLFAYAISFAVIGRFWVVHHRFFGDVTGFDNRLLALNLFYLAWIVLMPFSSGVLGDHGGDVAAVVLYAVNLIGVILAGTLLFVDARHAGLSCATAEEERAGRRSALAVAAVFALSIGVAFLISPEAATYCWLGLFFIPVAFRATRTNRT
ncbi:MAG TPA: TMEM175 family protein [Solirubrobacterales bacterium]|nr:TMEM175 family protein [Solirubrobacterales bacterium]